MNNTYYQEKIATLPENLQYAVMMSDWKESLVQIQNQFKLHIDQTQVLEDSTIKLMFGDIDAPDFINHMFNDAHINSETAADILLEVDLKILKNIRERLEAQEDSEKEEEDVEKILMSDEERLEKEEAENYAEYYGKVDEIKKQTEEELLKEGILPDGSNITDEMLGITQEIPTDVRKEKDDLLNEIDAPSKSFTIENPYTPAATPIDVDHQIENVSIEEPFREESIIPETPHPVLEEKIETKHEEPKTEIKKPITINLDDIYREPIE